MESHENNQPNDANSRRKYIEVPPDAHEKAVAYSKKTKLPMKAVVATLIDLCVEYDLLKPGWTERLNMAMAMGEGEIQRNRYEALDDPCPKLKYANDRWNCVGSGGKTKILSKKLIDATELCSACPEPRRKREKEAFFERTRRRERQ